MFASKLKNAIGSSVQPKSKNPLGNLFAKNLADATSINNNNEKTPD